MSASVGSIPPVLLRPLALALASALILGGCSVIPTPLSDADRTARASDDRSHLFEAQEPLGGPLTLEQAVARGIRYNLDHRVRLMEETLASGALEVSRYDLWPQLMAQAGYSSRDSYAASESVSIDSRQTSLEPSFSTEKQQGLGGLRFSWNILDFGVSYAQAQQRADEVLVVGELRRKAEQNLVLDIQAAWWRVAAAQQSAAEIQTLLVQAEDALAKSGQSLESRLNPPLKALTLQKGLLELINRLAQLRKEARIAHVQLAGLLNLVPGTPYEVASSPEELPQPPALAVEEMESLALTARPELREEDYRKRITAQEARKALLRMLPGIELNAGANYDSNKYLDNQSWADAGLQVSWNLFSVFSGPAARRYAEGQMDLGDLRRLALSVAVITQVHVAREQHEQALADYRTAVRLDEVEGKIATQLEAEQRASRVDPAQVVMGRASALAAKLRRSLAFAELQSSVARIRHSVGEDPVQVAAQGS